MWKCNLALCGSFFNVEQFISFFLLFLLENKSFWQFYPDTLPLAESTCFVYTHTHTHKDRDCECHLKLFLYWVRIAIISEATSLWASIVVSEKALKGVQQYREGMYKPWGLSTVCATLALYIQKNSCSEALESEYHSKNGLKKRGGRLSKRK